MFPVLVLEGINSNGIFFIMQEFLSHVFPIGVSDLLEQDKDNVFKDITKCYTNEAPYPNSCFNYVVCSMLKI